jgi:hypothetical protein
LPLGEVLVGKGGCFGGGGFGGTSTKLFLPLGEVCFGEGGSLVGKSTTLFLPLGEVRVGKTGVLVVGGCLVGDLTTLFLPLGAVRLGEGGCSATVDFFLAAAVCFGTDVVFGFDEEVPCAFLGDGFFGVGFFPFLEDFVFASRDVFFGVVGFA